MDSARPLLAPMCREIVFTGAVPSAMACKMAVNLYLIASVAALAEATALATALKLDPAFLAQVIGSGPLGSAVANSKLAKMATGDFAPHAAISDVCKNAALVHERRPRPASTPACWNWRGRATKVCSRPAAAASTWRQ